MERLKVFFLAGVFILFLTTTTFAVRLSITPLNDTFYNWAGYLDAYQVDDSNMSKVQGGKEKLVTHSQGNTQAYWEAYLKFNVSTLQKYILSNANITYVRKGACGALPFRIGISDYADWTDNMTNETGMSRVTYKKYLDTAQSVFISTAALPAVWKAGSANFTLNRSAIEYLYNDTDELVTIIIRDPTGSYSCTNNGDQVQVASMESGQAAVTLNFDGGNYALYFINATNPDLMYIDLETGTWNTTAFYEADVIYDVDNNILYPRYPTEISRYPIYSTDTGNASLETLVCNDEGNNQVSYTSTQRTFVNYYMYADAPNRKYDQWCFDQEGSHNGNRFFAAIKIVKYTTYCVLADCHDVEMYVALYSPYYVTFSEPILSPDPPIYSEELAIRFFSSINLQNSGVRLRYKTAADGAFSNWFTIYDEDSGLKTAHYAVVNATLMRGLFYEYYVFGSDSLGVNYTSSNFTFYVKGAPPLFDTKYENSTILQVAEKWKDAGLCSDFLGCLNIIAGFLLVGVTIAAGLLVDKKFALVIFSIAVLAFGVVGWLPSYIVIPVIFVAMLPLIKIFFSIIRGGKND